MSDIREAFLHFLTALLRCIPTALTGIAVCFGFFLLWYIWAGSLRRAL